MGAARSPSGRALLVALPALAVTCGVAVASAAAAPLVGGRVGAWDLGRLGAHAPLRIAPGHAGAEVRFRLPRGTRQGRPLWYLVRLQATVRFARGVRGKFLLTADVNGATAAQIPIIVRRGSLRLEELGLVEGRRSRTVAGRHARLDFRNYIQISGIRGGLNVLHFAIEPLTVRGLALPHAFEVAVLGGSGIEATRALPDELLLSAQPPDVTAHVGQPVEVGYLLQRRGGWPDGPVEVRYAAGGLELQGADVQRHPRVDGGVRGAFTVSGETPGTYMTMLSVPDRFNEPSTPVTVTIVADTQSTAGPAARLGRIGGGGLVVLSGAALLLRRRRSSGRADATS